MKSSGSGSHVDVSPFSDEPGEHEVSFDIEVMLVSSSKSFVRACDAVLVCVKVRVVVLVVSLELFICRSRQMTENEHSADRIQVLLLIDTRPILSALEST